MTVRLFFCVVFFFSFLFFFGLERLQIPAFSMQERVVSGDMSFWVFSLCVRKIVQGATQVVGMCD